MKIVPYKSFWLSLSTILVVSSIAIIATFGLRLSADFTEGTLIALDFTDVNTAEAEDGEAADMVNEKELLDAALASFTPAEGQEGLGNVEIKSGSDGTFIMKMRRLTDGQDEALLSHLREEVGDFDLIQSRDVSPVFAQTFKKNALEALGAAVVAIVLYITFAFRKVSRGIASWKLGVSAIFALVHDVLIIVAIFSLLGAYYQVEVDALFITALLSVLGFSVNDTIVVFDRVRENLLHKKHDDSFDDVAEKSLHQTMGRSINTSFSTFVVLACLLFLGAQEIYYFVFALIAGVAVGTYSSIFLATPLLSVFHGKD